MKDEPRDEQTQAEGEHTYEIYQRYEEFLGHKDGYATKDIAFDLATDSFDHVALEKYLPIFEKYIPFIEKHFDNRHQFNLSLIVGMLDQESSRRALVALYPIFDSNPRLLELYSKRSYYADKDSIEDRVNKEDWVRLMFTKDSTQEEATEREIEELISKNKELYQKLSAKYKDIDQEQIVVCTLFDDAEVCVRFLNRNLKLGADGKDSQIGAENIQSCQIMIRPNQHEKKDFASEFMLMELHLTASGLIYDEGSDKAGFLFLAPPKGRRFDEKALMELIVSEKSDKEIQEELENGATGIAEILTAGS